MRVQCRTCRGIYLDVDPDGVRYFHACPPLSLAELEAAVAAGTVQLERDETPATAHASRVFPRPTGRDENIDLAKVAAVRRPDGSRPRELTPDTLIKAAGTGVDVLPGPSRAPGPP